MTIATRSLLVVSLVAGLLAPATADTAAPPVAAGPERAAAVDRVLLANAKILVGDGSVIDDAWILIEDGKIARITQAPITDVDVDIDASYDLEGRVVTPGLIAADTTIGLVEIGLEDSTRDDSRQDESPIKAGYDPAPAINADSSLIAIQAVEGVTTAAVAPQGGLIAGEVAWIDMLPGDYTGVVAAAHIGVAANFGRSYAGSRAAALAQLRETFEDARWYRDNQRNYERNQARELVAHPADLRALWPVLDREIPLLVRAHRASDLLALIELAEELNIEITILGATEGWKVAAQLAAAKVTVVVSPIDNLPGSFDTLGARLDNAKLLHDAGVTVAIAEFDSHNVRNVTQQAGIAVAHGLPADAALQAITLNVARAYGMDDDYGTVAVGKVASLVVWDGEDPFELSTWAEQVWVRGRKIDMRSRQTQLRDRYMNLDTFE